MTLVVRLYRATRTFPNYEIYGLTSQLRRAAVSIPSNIAEGSGRRTTREYLRFLQMSLGSLFEAQTQLEIARDLSFMDTTGFEECYSATREIERMLSSMIKKLEDKVPQAR